jgi:hypothetical protein
LDVFKINVVLITARNWTIIQRLALLVFWPIDFEEKRLGMEDVVDFTDNSTPLLAGWLIVRSGCLLNRLFGEMLTLGRLAHHSGIVR